MEDFADRLKMARERAEISVPQIAKRLGVSVQAVYGWEQGAIPKAKRLNELAAMLGCSIQWLVYGDSGSEPVAVRDEDGGLAVPQLNVTCSAGGGAFHDEYDGVVRLMEFSQSWLNSKEITQRSSLRVYTVSGDSMDPLIKDEAILLVDSSVTSVERDGIYVVSYDGRTYCKRAQWIPGNTLLLLSENSSYRDITIHMPTDESQDPPVYVLGLVVYSWNGERR